jgi:topoisomerase-4 subunit A
MEAVAAQTRSGRQVLNLHAGEEAVVCAKVEGDSVACIGENRKLLIFPLGEVPEMTRGRGVIMQRYKDGGLSDAKTFRLKDGLAWRTGTKTRTETDLIAWRGKRAQAGRLPPKGFSRVNRFS